MTEKRNKMMREPEKITKTAIQTLKKKYGYTDKQIITGYEFKKNDQNKNLDIVIFSNEDNTHPKVIGEIKIGDFVFPFAENQLERSMNYTNAKYGFLTNGIDWINYKIINKKLIRTPTISSKITLQSKIKNTDTKQKFRQLTDSSYIIKKISNQSRIENHISFNEYLQLIFFKIYDEKYEKNKYFEKIRNEPDICLQIFQTLWEKSNKKFPGLFKQNYLEFPGNQLNSIIEMSNYSITKADPISISNALLMLYYHVWNKPKGNFITPSELLELIDRLEPISNNEKILIPYSGPDRCIQILQLILSKFSNKFKGEITVIEPELENVRFLRIISELRLPKFKIVTGDPIEILNSDKSKEYDHVISIPPMRMKIQKNYNFEQKHDEKSNISDAESEMLGNDSINHFFNRLISRFKNGAKFSIIVPQGFLFRQSFSSNSIRRQILDNCSIKAIISLSTGTFPHSGVASALLLLEKGTSNLETYNIFMAVLSKPGLKEYFPEGVGVIRKLPAVNPYLKNVEQVSNLFQEFIEKKSISNSNQLGFIVNLSEILKNGWTVTDKIPEIKLFDIPDKQEILNCVEIIRGTSIPFKTSSTGEEFNFIKISDFNNNSLDLEKTKKIFLDKNEISKIERFLIKKDDILFSCRGTIGKKLLVKNELKNCIASSNLMILRPESSLIHPEYLQYILDKEIAKDQIAALSGGIAIPMLTLTKFSKIIIPVPSILKQKQIISKAIASKEEISKIEKILEEAKRKYQEL